MSLFPPGSPAQCASAALALAIGTAAAQSAPPSPDLEALAAEVRAAETAFARTMAERRLDAFADFVAEDAAFRGRTVRVGRAEVVAGWRPLFDGPQAPFSWAPDAVTVAADGRLAISTGPVRDTAGRMTGRFTSIWRRDADGHWRVIVDQGVDACDCAPPR